MFSSPRGDKLQFDCKRLAGSYGCFRPLTGINCNYVDEVLPGDTFRVFPSPYGDKLQYCQHLRKDRE